VRIAGAGVCLLALVPGLPKLPFLFVGAGVFLLGGRLPKEEDKKKAATAAAPAPQQAAAPDSPEALAKDMKVDPLELEVAYNMVELVDPARGGDLLDRVKALRRKVALDLGVVLPLVRTRDNIDLPASTYVIKVNGAEAARGTAVPGQVLAIGDMLTTLPGMPTKEPVFGLDAKWVPASARSQAERVGATVVDPASVVTTHLAEVVRQTAGKLLSRAGVKDLVEMTKRTDPTAVEELGTAQVTLAEVQRVLHDLLEEGVSVRNLSRIFEVLSEKARTTRDPEALVEGCRQALGPALSAALSVDGHLPVITVDPMLEQQLAECLRNSDNGSFFALAPDKAEALTLAVSHKAKEAEADGEMPVLVCAAPLRQALRKLVRTAAPRLPVLSYAELGTQLRLETKGVVNLAHATV